MIALTRCLHKLLCSFDGWEAKQAWIKKSLPGGILLIMCPNQSAARLISPCHVCNVG